MVLRCACRLNVNSERHALAAIIARWLFAACVPEHLMKPIVIFGTGKIAEVLLYYFRNHSSREVVACTVDAAFVKSPEWNGMPVVAFSDVAEAYPPATHDMFVALGYQDLNRLREERCRNARELGYTLASYISPEAHLPLDCVYGDNCFVMSQALVHPRVVLGNNVFVWSGAMIGHHSVIGDNCWLTSCCNVSGDVRVGKNCFLAVNSTVGNSVTVGDDCFLGANALVVKCTQSGEAYLAESTKPFRLSSRQFLRISRLGEL